MSLEGGDVRSNYSEIGEGADHNGNGKLPCDQVTFSRTASFNWALIPFQNVIISGDGAILT
jgi:hypothetical protein